MRRTLITIVTGVVATCCMASVAHAADAAPIDPNYGAAVSSFTPQPPAAVLPAVVVQPVVLSASLAPTAASSGTLPVTGGSTFSQLQVAISVLGAGLALMAVATLRKRSDKGLARLARL
jgi:hypothetical protein